MRTSSKLSLLIIAGLLQGCATSVSHPEAKGSRQMLTGSKSLSVSSEECPRGIGMVRLYSNTLDGNKTTFNAKIAYTSKPIEQKINVYNLLDENHADLLAKGERNQAKAVAKTVDSSNNSIVIKLSGTKVGSAQKVTDGTTLLKNSDGTQVKMDDEFSVPFNPKTSIYSNWGHVQNGVLSSVDDDTKASAVIHSVYVKIGKNYPPFSVPDTLDAVDLEHPLDQAFSEIEGKKVISINVAPKTTDTKSIFYVQFNNNKKGGEAKTYNYITDETPGVKEIQVPTEGIAGDDYVINVFRSEIKPVLLDEADPKSVFCMEVATGFMGRATVK